MENLNLVEVNDKTNKRILTCVLSALGICAVIYYFLKNRTIEVEKFTNQTVLYSSNGQNIEDKD
jgi:hypothetical protein